MMPFYSLLELHFLSFSSFSQSKERMWGFMVKKESSENAKNNIEDLLIKESPMLRFVRDSAGVVSAAGILILAVYAMKNLKSGWVWTMADEEKKNSG